MHGLHLVRRHLFPHASSWNGVVLTCLNKTATSLSRALDRDVVPAEYCCIAIKKGPHLWSQVSRQIVFAVEVCLGILLFVALPSNNAVRLSG